MASIKFILKGSDNPSTVLVRFTNGRKQDFKRSTFIQVDPDHWNYEKGELRRVATAVNRDVINSQLQALHSFIVDAFNADHRAGKIISSEWLKRTINRFNDQEEETDLNLFVQFGKSFIENLPNRVNHAKGSRLGVAESTVKKYNTVIRRIENFEKHRGSKLYLRDIDLKFQRDIIKYMRNVEKLSENYTGRQLAAIKTVCIDAKLTGIKTHPELERIKGFTTQVSFIYFDEEEIESIEMFDFKKSPFLDNARDWLLIGLNSGQRISDFMAFTVENLKGDYLEFIQQKTNKKIKVPINASTRRILDKYDGQFPRKISHQKFNDYIKIVCEKIGISEEVEGGRANPETKRKEYGKFPKHELVTSHICRRSFATNHYGKLPTPVLMGITGHSTEKMFLNYIGKTQSDYAETLKDYWDQIEKAKQTGVSPMEVVKEVG